MLESVKSRPWAIILAAGKGTRLSSHTGNVCKQFVLYKNKPLFWQSAITFASSSLINGFVFVFPSENFENYQKQLEQLCSNNILGVPWKATIGGETRRDSVYSALIQIPNLTDHVIIHDAARPFFKSELVFDICKMLDRGFSAVVPGIPVTDTIKICTDNNLDTVEQTLPREKLVAVQTPQAFSYPCLMKAHQDITFKDQNITDDAMLMEIAGHQVHIIKGDQDNIKITYPRDLKIFESGTEAPVPCSGFGYDVHRFGEGRPLKIGGVTIPGNLQIIAHSDGDVLLHALIDAILGCACLGDIGQLFPDNDPEFEGISSAILLKEVIARAEEAGFSIYQADLTLVAQKPRLGHFRDEIRKNVAQLLNLSPDKINIKTTTEEGMGFTGALEGIKAYVLVNGWKKNCLS